MTTEQLTGLNSSHLVPLMVGTKVFSVHPQVADDLQRLIAAAEDAGFECRIASGFRDFARQCTIWNRKFSGELPVLDDNSKPVDIQLLTPQQLIFTILRWSALPGASRHHWGTDFDVYCEKSLGDQRLKLEPCVYQTGHQAQFSSWLQANMDKYGFFLPYRKDLGGVNIEPWHISHRRTANQCLSELTIELLDSILAQQHISGKEVVREQLQTIYNQFILGINQ